MAINKIMLANGDILLDLTNDTVTPETLAEGVTAHDKSGELIVGTMASSVGLTFESLLLGDEPSGAVVIELTNISNTNKLNNLFSYSPNLTSCRMPNAKNVTSCPSFRECKSLTDVYIPSVTTTASQAFNSAGFFGTMDLSKMFPNLKTLANTTFNNLNNVNKIILPATLTTVNATAFNTPMLGLTDIVFLGKPTTINANMVATGVAPYITDIWVPWSEGEVANAPWGATNATIHYNHVYTDQV